MGLALNGMELILKKMSYESLLTSLIKLMKKNRIEIAY